MNSFFYASHSYTIPTFWNFYVSNVIDRPLSLLTIMKNLSLSEDQIKLLADAIWMRQRCFVAGDKRFKEYGAMLDTLLEDMDYVPNRS